MTFPSAFLAALSVFLLALLGMSIGVIVARKRIKGSCGGLAAWRDELGNSICDACADCPEKKGECELEGASARTHD